ncbi:VOC family protein [Pseudoalteromonas byunsanensis]|uniref:Glyoxalase n=1 Tax=Pseudoalteromonas byunsanensis TaxID=327939 RepID=A0A1S1NCM7_9GAMM|nr:VOC family protein [Pseudoalteromonas byunsanensis]OHU97546.1 glyoxalase [Pseudoalteromonas byunsanensis]
MNLNQITLGVHNMEQATTFYRQLGFLQIVDTPHYARFECANGATFSLSLEDNMQPNNTTIYFEHEQLNEWVNELQTKGITFDSLPENKRYLWREAQLRDPSGNKIKLYWAGDNRLNPPWRTERRND